MLAWVSYSFTIWSLSAGTIANNDRCLEHACRRCGWVKCQPTYVHVNADMATIRTHQNDPKAKQSCYGLHTEPCPRYHHIMFQLGMSHNCYPCLLSKEQHEKRHTTVGDAFILPPLFWG
jgi:hypothetical protein